MRRPAKPVGRSHTNGFTAKWELVQHALLAAVLGQQTTFFLPLWFREWTRPEAACPAKEAFGFHSAAWCNVITREFKNIGSRFIRKLRTSNLHSGGTGIVIGMTAFIRMGKDTAWTEMLQ